MEKIAIISDVHGNYTALQKVLNDIEKRGIKRIFCLGDMLVKCSSPKKCVETILNRCEVVLMGNCESRATITQLTDEHAWNGKMLSKELFDKVSKLPLSYDFYISGLKVRLMHASPFSIHEKSYYWDMTEGFDKRAIKMFENTEYLNNIGQDTPDVVIFGHIHRPFAYRSRPNKKLLINPGAVSNTSEIININGKDYTYGSYIILEGEFNSKEISSFSYEFVKFSYDNEKEARNILETDMPNKEASAEEILTGKYFDRKKLNQEAAAQWKK